MVASYTPNIQLTEPARGDNVGTWDTPMNGNTTIIDLVVGGIASITLNNSPVVLSAAQFQAKQITLVSTLTGNVTITFPTSFTKTYEIQNQCTGSSAYVITLATTAGGQVICIPPGETIDCFNDGSNLKFKNLGRVGSYWDYAGSSVPAWVSGCTQPPYLNCDGSTFSATTFPALAVILGGTTLPDSKGRSRMALDQGAGRVSSAVAGFSPTTVGAAGGTQAVTLGASNLPAHSHPVSDPGHVNGIGVLANGGQTVQFGSVSPPLAINNASGSTTYNSCSAVTGITVSNSTYANSAAVVFSPIFVGGLTLIRAG